MGEENLSSADNGGRGWMSALFGAKNFRFIENYGVSAWTSGGGEVEPVRIFCGQGERKLIFRDFFGRILWTAP